MFFPFTVIWSMQKDKNYPDKSSNFWLGAEAGIQLELFFRHIIHIGFTVGMKRGHVGGGGIGYSYELGLVRSAAWLELGLMVGKFTSDISDEKDMEGRRRTYLLLRPTFHFGYRSVFFSFGPRMYIGKTVLMGLAVGFLFRI